jgi:hypothetical protein
VAARWHYADQKKTDAPITSAELRALVWSGRLKPTDLVRAKGMERWVPAAKVAGLFLEPSAQWYFAHAGNQFGPVSGTLLKTLAKAGMLEPTDLVWREGFDTWKQARRLAGLFPPARLERPAAPLRVPSARAAAAAAAATATATATAISDRVPGRQRGRVLGFMGLAGLLVAAGLVGTILQRSPRAQPDATVPAALDAIQGSPASVISASLPIEGENESADLEPARPIERAETTRAKPVEHPSYPMPGANQLLDEPALGRLVHARVLRDHRAVSSPPLIARVENAVAGLLKLRERPELEYHFVVLDSDAVNAFSHVGGYIYLSRGLFNLVASDVELAWVVGHEIAHVDLGHRLASPLPASDVPVSGPDLADACYRQIAGGHSSADEYAADAWTMRRLLELGHTRRQCLAFLKRYRTYLDQDLPPRDAKAPSPSPAPDLAAGTPSLDRQWLTMPAPELRLNQLEKPDLSSP